MLSPSGPTGQAVASVKLQRLPLTDDRADSAPPKPARKTDPRLLELLVCPVTRAELIYDAERQELISRPAKLAYPIRDGVPIMLPEEARKLDG